MRGQIWHYAQPYVRLPPIFGGMDATTGHWRHSWTYFWYAATWVINMPGFEFAVNGRLYSQSRIDRRLVYELNIFLVSCVRGLLDSGSGYNFRHCVITTCRAYQKVCNCILTTYKFFSQIHLSIALEYMSKKQQDTMYRLIAYFNQISQASTILKWREHTVNTAESTKAGIFLVTME